MLWYLYTDVVYLISPFFSCPFGICTSLLINVLLDVFLQCLCLCTPSILVNSQIIPFIKHVFGYFYGLTTVCPKHLIILKVLKSPYVSKRVSFLITQLTNHRNRVVISPSYSGGTEFKSWPWNRLLVRVFVVFLIPFKPIPGYYLKLGHVASFCFLSNSLFINDPNIRRCIVGATNSVIKQTTNKLIN
jgi:hypothetical protein